tara:strand:+ start:720 stop:2747 length:2028 start_codon:yes stop_codon:yes gene_type:complete
VTFLNSPLLWTIAGAIGVAVPVIIHLLHQRHRRHTDWAAMELLRRALVVRSGQVKLEDILLLLLRCLVLALVAFALVRPTLEDQAEGGLLGEQRVGMVIAIDASFSMDHGKYDTRMEEARQRVSKILETAKEGDPITIVLMAESPRTLLRGANFNLDRCNDALEKAEVFPERFNLERATVELATLVDELKGSVKECYLVTDAQAVDWANFSKEAANGLETLARKSKLFLVPVETEGRENLAITDFSYASGSLGPGGLSRFTAEVRNFGLQTHDGGSISLSVNDRNGTPRSFGPIKPGESRLIDFYPDLDLSGDANLTASLGRNDDALAIDNRRMASVRVSDRIRILCIDGEPFAGDGPGETFWLRKALELNQLGDDASIEVVVTDWQETDPSAIGEYDLVFAANVEEVDSSIARSLDSFVRKGGGLVLFAGDRMDLPSYNENLGGLLPGELIGISAFGEGSETVGDSPGETSWTLAEPTSSHVLSQLTRTMPQEGRDAVRFRKSMEIRPDDNATIVLSLSGNGSPLVLEKQVDSGSVLFFATTADRDWSNLVVHPLFPMLMQQSITHLTNRPEAGRAGNLNPSESDLGQASAESLEEALSPLNAVVIPIAANLGGIVKETRKGTEISRTLLILALLVFLLQGYLARLFTNRMTSKGESSLQESLRKHTVVAARRT